MLAWLVARAARRPPRSTAACHAGRSLTTTQRALKRLADAGLLARFQLHRDDGGGIPQCVAVTTDAIVALGVSGRRAPSLGDRELGRLRGDVHVTGWLLALEEHAGAAIGEVLGPGRATLAPPDGAGPQALVLADGERPRDFLATGADGARAPPERFAPLRPRAVVEFSDVTDLLVFWDGPDVLATLERVDHLLGGWWRSVARYREPAPGRAASGGGRVRRRGDRPRCGVAELADRLLSSALAEIGRAAGPLGPPGPGRRAHRRRGRPAPR